MTTRTNNPQVMAGKPEKPLEYIKIADLNLNDPSRWKTAWPQIRRGQLGEHIADLKEKLEKAEAEMALMLGYKPKGRR